MQLYLQLEFVFSQGKNNPKVRLVTNVCQQTEEQKAGQEFYAYNYWGIP